jgi:hypothetical protein
MFLAGYAGLHLLKTVPPEAAAYSFSDVPRSNDLYRGRITKKVYYRGHLFWQ